MYLNLFMLCRTGKKRNYYVKKNILPILFNFTSTQKYVGFTNLQISRYILPA